MSEYEGLDEVDLRPNVEWATAHNAKGGRKGVRTIMNNLNERRRHEPLWRKQLRSAKATAAKRELKKREG